jgi:hypothetical protein
MSPQLVLLARVAGRRLLAFLAAPPIAATPLVAFLAGAALLAAPPAGTGGDTSVEAAPPGGGGGGPVVGVVPLVDVRRCPLARLRRARGCPIRSGTAYGVISKLRAGSAKTSVAPLASTTSAPEAAFWITQMAFSARSLSR